MDARQAKIVSFSQTDESWISLGDGLACTTTFIGPRNDPAAPALELVRAGQDVGDRVAGVRTHDTPCMTIVVEGSIQLDGRWLAPGDIELAPAGVAHGDLVIGPDGVVFAIMFAQRAGMVPKFASLDDQHRFDTEYRSVLDAVARGDDERPAVVLPPRDTYTPRRGAAITNPAEVERLRQRGPAR